MSYLSEEAREPLQKHELVIKNDQPSSYPSNAFCVTIYIRDGLYSVLETYPYARDKVNSSKISQVNFEQK